MRTGAVGTTAIESRPICLSSARRRRLNSSRPTEGTRTTVGTARLRFSLLMDGRGTRLRLLAARGRKLHEQQLHTDSHELHDLGERYLVLFIFLVGLDADVGDLGEITNDLAGLGGHFARVT